jgi:hypothetical protein
VLARVEEEEGVETAEVDRRGELMRLRLKSVSDTSRLVDLLRDLGFAGEVVGDADVRVPHWYGLGSVGELSREEATIIARRVVPVFAQHIGLAATEVDAVTDLVATALYDCIRPTTLDPSTPPGALNSACGLAVQDAARQRLGPYRAAALGHAIEADLAERSAFKE